MVPRKIIADSDDEDEDLDINQDDFSPPTSHDTQRREPEIEPLSSQHQPTIPIVQQLSDVAESNSNFRNHTSGSTDLSFFTNVYDDQQNKALRQSHLIENIVRLSQKASTSSEEISLPTKAKGKMEVADVSSATDITSPLVMSRAGPRKSQLAQMSDATEFTTPRKSAGKDEWDVPSSGEEGAARKSVKKSKETNSKTCGKRKRNNSGLARSAFDTEELETVHQIDPSRQPTTKKRKKAGLALEETVIQESGNFYVAPSNLSASEKRQYQTVQSSELQTGEMERPPIGSMQPPSNHKSSGASTIPYSTPSRYASSGPKLPSEAGQSAIMQNGSIERIIESISSPDAIAPRRNISKSQRAAPAFNVDTWAAEDEEISSPKSSTKKRFKPKDDIDELGHDDSWDSDTIGRHREVYKPRPSRRRSNAASIHRVQAEVEPDTEVPFEDPESDLDPEYGEIATSRKTKCAAKTTKPSLGAQDTAQPKKRGRKKKQPVSEEVIIDEEVVEQMSNVAEFNAPSLPPKMEQAAEIPKKKRGRPRKSEGAKTENTINMQIGAETTPTSDDLMNPAPAKKTLAKKNAGTVSETAKEMTTQTSLESGNADKEPEVEDDKKRSVSPLKEIDRNSLLTSQSTISDSDKSMAASMKKPTLSQAGKSLYRVGLSKRSRIAPLLKSLKK